MTSLGASGRSSGPGGPGGGRWTPSREGARGALPPSAARHSFLGDANRDLEQRLCYNGFIKWEGRLNMSVKKLEVRIQDQKVLDRKAELIRQWRGSRGARNWSLLDGKARKMWEEYQRLVWID